MINVLVCILSVTTSLVCRLVCEVSYNNFMGIQTSFRKFFKIQVLKPLDVKTKFYNAENDDVYLEAQVQNITKGPICLEKIALDASHLFKGKLIIKFTIKLFTIFMF